MEKCCHFFDLMRLFVGSNPMRVMASGAVDVNHKDEMYNGKVTLLIGISLSDKETIKFIFLAEVWRLV